jgi:hypothetical protein
VICELEPPGSDALVIDCPFPEALAVNEGNNPGWVFADDLNTPRTALVWARGIEGFYLDREGNQATEAQASALAWKGNIVSDKEARVNPSVVSAAWSFADWPSQGA